MLADVTHAVEGQTVGRLAGAVGADDRPIRPQHPGERPRAVAETEAQQAARSRAHRFLIDPGDRLS